MTLEDEVPRPAKLVSIPGLVVKVREVVYCYGTVTVFDWVFLDSDREKEREIPVFTDALFNVPLNDNAESEIARRALKVVHLLRFWPLTSNNSARMNVHH